ncbi:MAG: T9SS type A sorting domain-containing protein [Chitinophagales bacterium]
MKTFTFLKGLFSVLVSGILLANTASAQSLTASPVAILVPATTTNVTLTHSIGDWAGSGTYTLSVSNTTGVTNPGGVWPWTNWSGLNSAAAQIITFSSAASGTYVFTLTRSTSTATVTVFVDANPGAANLWATSSSGTVISSFTVSQHGVYVNGPTTVFNATFPGTTTGGTSTAALGRTDKPTPSTGYFYYIPNTSGNSGVVEVYGSDGTTASNTRLGSIDLNGASTTSLGFVRLGMAGDGTGWLLAGDGSNIYLASFATNLLNPVTITTKTVTLSGGFASVFQNGDVCIDGTNNMYALGNDGSGATQIFVGSLSNPTVTLTKRWDLVDQNGVTFNGTVNGNAFDLFGNMYISTSSGLFFIDASTVNSSGTGTVQCRLVQSQSGLQDLASNVWPARTTLPINLTNFTVTKSGNNGLLQWSTATEVNNDHFDIERSSDGINFSKIGAVRGNGTTSTISNYQFIDPLSNVLDKILYYRLQQVDIDSKGVYSKIVALRLNGTIVKNFTVYPNPFTSDIKVQITSSKESTAIIRISNTSGQQVVNRSVNLQVGDNIIVLQNLEALTSGVHLMEVITEDGKFTQKIVKK